MQTKDRREHCEYTHRAVPFSLRRALAAFLLSPVVAAAASLLAHILLYASAIGIGSASFSWPACTGGGNRQFWRAFRAERAMGLACPRPSLLGPLVCW